MKSLKINTTVRFGLIFLILVLSVVVVIQQISISNYRSEVNVVDNKRSDAESRASSLSSKNDDEVARLRSDYDELSNKYDLLAEAIRSKHAGEMRANFDACKQFFKPFNSVEQCQESAIRNFPIVWAEN